MSCRSIASAVSCLKEAARAGAFSCDLGKSAARALCPDTLHSPTMGADGSMPMQDGRGSLVSVDKSPWLSCAHSNRDRGEFANMANGSFPCQPGCCGTFPADASSRARIPLSEAGLPPAAAHSLDISRISPGKSCVSLDTRLPRDVVNPCPNAAYSSPAAANTVTPPVAIATIAFRS